MNERLRDDVVARLRGRILSGENWHRAMLLAVSEWPLEEETLDGDRFLYLIDGEALDLPRIYDRLALQIADLVSEDELEALLVYGKSPVGLSRDEMKSLMGNKRYNAYLTFIYGVLVEEMVVLAVLQDIRKKRRASGLTRYDANPDDAYRYVYRASRLELLNSFRKERGLKRKRSIDLTQLREFTYWLFKLRLRNSDKSRVASDTKRALVLLQHFAEVKGRLAL